MPLAPLPVGSTIFILQNGRKVHFDDQYLHFEGGAAYGKSNAFERSKLVPLHLAVHKYFGSAVHCAASPA